MDYFVLVDNILKNPILSKAVQDLEERTRALNLITPTWKEVLKKSPAYEAHSNRKAVYFKGHKCSNEKAYIRSLKNKNERYAVIVAGEWSLAKSEEDDYSVVCRESEPMRKIAWSMREKDQDKLHDGGRFFIRTCNPMLCHDCSKSHAIHGVPLLRKNWCIKSLRVFDGKEIKSAFTKCIQDNLVGSFMGILHVVVHKKTTYGEDCFKVGGDIEELIIFQNSVLLPAPILVEEPVPAVEFPCAAAR